MKTKKKAFTLIELLVVMIVTMVVMVLLIALLSKTFKVYNETTTRDGTYGYVVLLVSDVETLSRGCDYALVDDGNRILKVVTDGVTHSISGNEYGIDVTFDVDNSKQLIKITHGGEEYCVNYIQNLQN